MTDELFENDAERAWSQSSPIHGVDQDLMSARLNRDEAPQPELAPAAFAPSIIPITALMAGPLIAALVALMTDGRPPKVRQATALLSVGIGAWLLRQGMVLLIPDPIAPRQEPFLVLALLLVTGATLWAIYTFWQQGRRGADRQTLVNSAILLIVLSALYWFGRNTTWWAWLGR